MLQCGRSGLVLYNQLPEGWVWAAPCCGCPSSVLWLDGAAEQAALGGAVEEALIPLEVLTELCWMASFWGLLGTDISSQLSSLSETVRALKKRKWNGHAAWILNVHFFAF